MSPRLVALAAAVAVLGWWAGTPVAAAHDGLVSATPADGQSVDASPGSVELEFSGQLQDLVGGTAVVVRRGDRGGEVVSTGAAEVDGSSVRTALQPALPDDEYLVTYRVVSSDGHEVEGTTRFFVGPVPPGAGAPFGSDEPAQDGAEVPLALVVVVGAAAVLVTVAVVLVRSRRDRERS